MDQHTIVPWPGDRGIVRYPDPAIEEIDPRFKKYRIGNAALPRHRPPGSAGLKARYGSAMAATCCGATYPTTGCCAGAKRSGPSACFVPGFSNNSNGNTRDRQGRQLSCEHGNRRVVRYEHDGSTTVLAERFQGKPFNAPNDIVVHPDGGIWFTDPGYGSLMNYEGNKGARVQGSRGYRIDPKAGRSRR